MTPEEKVIVERLKNRFVCGTTDVNLIYEELKMITPEIYEQCATAISPHEFKFLNQTPYMVNVFINVYYDYPIFRVINIHDKVDQLKEYVTINEHPEVIRMFTRMILTGKP